MNIRFRATLPQMQSAIKIGGDQMRITFDVPASDVQNAIPLAALQNVVLRVTVEVDGARHPEAPVKKEKPGKDGPHGKFWEAMRHRHYYADMGLLEVLAQEGYEPVGDDNNVVAPALRKMFSVSSRTHISPEQFERFCETHELHNLVSMSRQIVAKMEGK